MLTNLWLYLRNDLCDGDQRKFLWLCITGINLLEYAILASLFFLVDTFKPSFIVQYKVQQTASMPQEKYWKALPRVFFNILFVQMPFAYIMTDVLMKIGCSHSEELPSTSVIVRDLAIAGLANEFWFYYSHRLVHYPPLYKRIHKIHHEWTSPVATMAIYCHPFEHVFSNLFSVYFGFLLAASHSFVIFLYSIIAIIVTIGDHSGYHLPLMKSPEFHDFHHLTFNYNFGVLGILDWLHGTDKAFREAKQSKHHHVLLSLKPVHEEKVE